MNLSTQQRAQLLRAINPQRVSKDGKGFSHLEAYEDRAHLNRIFGIGEWSEEVLVMELLFETSSSGDKPRWTVAYKAQCRLTIDGTVYTEWAVGDAQNHPSRADAHDMAMKTAASQAFKRCCPNLGDQFGLSLYNKGSLRPLVGRCLPWDEDTADVTDHITEPVAPENGDPETPQRGMSSPSAPDDQAAAGNPAESVEPETSPAADDPESGVPAADDEFSLILAQANLLDVPPASEAAKQVGDLMTQTAKFGLGKRKVPNDPKNRTLDAYLQAALKHYVSESKKQVA